ncbi:hypothetical protein FJ977_21160 [Mesorhizobium sp. B2-1-3A]|nr:hypothetical protein FJ977_21160 [Mesorhizobium sp. B2-1-3A]
MAGQLHMSFYEEDPHPNPPHKGGGNAAARYALASKLLQFAEFSAGACLPPPCGEGLGVGYVPGKPSGSLICDCPPPLGAGCSSLVGRRRLRPPSDSPYSPWHHRHRTSPCPGCSGRHCASAG